MGLAELLQGFNTVGIELDSSEAGLLMVEWKLLLQMFEIRRAWHNLVNLVVLLESSVQDFIFALMTFESGDSANV